MHAEITYLDRSTPSEVHSFVAGHARRLAISVDSGDPGLTHSLEAAGMSAWQDTAAAQHLYAGSDARLLLAQRVRASMLDFLRENRSMPALIERSDS